MLSVFLGDNRRIKGFDNLSKGLLCVDNCFISVSGYIRFTQDSDSDNRIEFD